MVANHQRHVSLNVPEFRAYVRRLRRLLRLGRRDFNVCFVADRETRKLNAAYRRKPRATDVLSFPWQEVEEPSALPRVPGGRPDPNGARGRAAKGADQSEFEDFLGDVVISAETARRNARAEGHSTAAEVRWLILHGLLHLLGHDHETDDGEMTRLELSLRAKLGV